MEALDELLAAVGEAIAPGDEVLELGCGAGRHTGTLAARAARVVAFDPSAAAIDRAMDRHMGTPRLTFVQGDGETLDGVEDASVDLVVCHALFHRLTSAKRVLGYVEETGRVLRPGGRAVLALSTDPAAAAPQPEPLASRRDLLRTLGGRRAAPAPRAGAYVPLEALGAVAVQAGLELERIEGAGTGDAVALARRPAA